MVDTGKAVTIGTFVILFLGVVVALAMLPEIGSQQNLMTDTQPFTETQTLTGCYADGVTMQVNTSNPSCNRTLTRAPSGNYVNCPLNSVVVTNRTSSVLTQNTDYKVYLSTGVVQYLNTSKTNATSLGTGLTHNNGTSASYEYCAEGYVTDSAGKSIVRLIGIFAALALVAFVIYYGVRQYF
jgi:hypothetical protein